MNRDELEPLPVDVVSVQSQVVYGYVGNSVAVPTMQAMGLNVVPVPTVLLSNIPHYDTLHGGPVPTPWFAGYLSDLERRGALTHARAIVLGYLGPPDQTAVLVEWLERVLDGHTGISLVLDPVMGDHDSGVYVHPDLPEVLRDRLVPLASGMTPNSFELERLVGRELPTMAETVSAAKDLLDRHARLEWVIVTSAAPDEAREGTTRVAVVTERGADVFEHQLLRSAAKGTGDLFTAALVGHVLRGTDLGLAARRAASDTLAVLARTAALGCGELVLG